MDDLLRSLRNLDLKPPDSSQLLDLLDEDEQVRARLAKLLSLSSLEALDDGSGLMGQDLLQEAVKALLDTFQSTVRRQQQTAERERLGQVKRIKWPPRKALLARQTAALQRLQRERQESPNYRPRLVFDSNESYCSTTTLAQLRRLHCADLEEAPRRYAGRYLLCRVISPLLLYAGVTFIVDDTTGTAVPVSVSHFTANLNLSTEEVSRLLPIGTVIAIREPFVSIDHQARAGPCSGKPDHGIRVDSPSDIVFWEQGDEKPIEWTVPLEAAAETLDQNSWLRASGRPEGYSTAEEVHHTVEMLLEQDMTGQAYRQIRQARQMGITVSPNIVGRVLFRLDAWEAAKGNFDESAASTSSGSKPKADEEAASDVSIGIDQLTDQQASLRCRLRTQQAATGISAADMRSIYFAAAKGFPRLDTSDYIGPVAVKDIPGAGRGMVTTRAVEAGELLLCCKAVCPTYADDDGCKGSPLLRLNLDNGVVSTASQFRAQTRLIHSIIDRPELALPILGLTAGPLIPNSDFVSHEYPLRIAPDLESDFDDIQRPDVDAGYVDAVLRFNAFGPASTPTRSDTGSSPGELERSTMPHPLLAILNHACLPNATSVFFSNIYTTRALCHLPAGTEIVHQYVKGEEPLAIRSANLSKHGFQCACLLCRLDWADGLKNCEIRARIVQGESKAVLDRSAILLKRRKDISIAQSEDEEAHEDIITSLEDLIARIQSTYAESRGSLRPDLFVAIDARTRHFATKSIDSAILSAKEALTCAGAVINDQDTGKVLQMLPRPHFDACVALMLFIATELATIGAKEQSLRWTKTAFWAHECTIGGGAEDLNASSKGDVFVDRWGTKDFQPALDLRCKAE